MDHLTPEQRQALIDAYRRQPRRSDDLPYTPAIGRMRAELRPVFGDSLTERDVWKAVSRLRKKKGQLPRKGR